MNELDLSTEKIIAELSSDLTRVETVGSALYPTVLMSLASIVAVAIGFAAGLNIRSDVSSLFIQPLFQIREAHLLLAALFATFAVQTLAIPGRSRLKYQLLCSLILPASFALTLLLKFALTSHFTPLSLHLSEAACTEAVLALSLGPSILLFFQIRRRATTHPAWTGALTGATTSLFASAALSLHCPNDGPIHLLAWHLLLPLSIAAAAGSLAGRQWLRW